MPAAARRDTLSGEGAAQFVVGTRAFGQRHRLRQNDAIALENAVCVFLRRAAAARFAAPSSSERTREPPGRSGRRWRTSTRVNESQVWTP